MSSCRASTSSIELDVQLILAGHGRPVRDATALIEANRRAVHERLDLVRAALSDGPRPAFEIVPEVVGYELPAPMMIAWGLSEVLSYLHHLELTGEVERVGDGEDGELWRRRAGR